MDIRSMSKVFLAGLVGQKPDIKVSGGGFPYCFFGVAIKDGSYDQDKNWSEEVFWISCKCNDHLAKLAFDKLDKGVLVAVDGKLRSYRTQDGKEHTYVKVDNFVVLQQKKECGGNYEPEVR